MSDVSALSDADIVFLPVVRRSWETLTYHHPLAWGNSCLLPVSTIQFSSGIARLGRGSNATEGMWLRTTNHSSNG